MSDARSTGSESEAQSKVTLELLSLYKDYSNFLASGRRDAFKSTNPSVQIVGDRVIVDAVASGDASALKADLQALGMRRAVEFGRVVSGELPISAIPAMASLRSLNFARASHAATQSGPKRLSPGVASP